MKYPVITFYLSGGDYNSPVGLSDTLGNVIDGCIAGFDLDREKISGDTLPVRFRNLIQCLYEKTGRQVVVLVDEYDKPLISNMISNPKQEEENRQLYKGFFSVLKDMDGYLKFLFFTGVTKFSAVRCFRSAVAYGSASRTAIAGQFIMRSLWLRLVTA
ncbi:MAG: AAA family ATPase [Candidatus Weimeria sp.]